MRASRVLRLLALVFSVAIAPADVRAQAPEGRRRFGADRGGGSLFLLRVAMPL